MSLKILIIASVIGLVGCDSKSYKKSENPNFDYIENLNQGESERIIGSLSHKEHLTPRESYYLGSALSHKAGVNVFSLYSILEMQLFRKSALDWSDLSKDKNPYLKFMKSQEDIDYKKLHEKREKRWEKNLPKILKRRNISTKKPGYEDEVRTYTSEEYQKIDELLKGFYDVAMKFPAVTSRRLQKFNQLLYSQTTFYFGHRLYTYYYDQIRLETLKENYIYPEKRPLGLFGSSTWSVVFMNLLWNTYEAIPIIKKIPDLDQGQQDIITQALESYRSIITDRKFKVVTGRNIGILTGVSVLSIYKSSFDIEQVNNMEDLLCSFEPQYLLDHYSLIRKRIIFLTEAFRESGGIDFGPYKASSDELEVSLPEALEPQDVAEYLQEIEEFKMNSCYSE